MYKRKVYNVYEKKLEIKIYIKIMLIMYWKDFKRV